MSRLAWNLLSLVKWGWLLVGLLLALVVLFELAAALSLRFFASGSPELPPGAPPTYECEVPVIVANFGQMGYVSTQDLITLLVELQRGDVPDVAGVTARRFADTAPPP